jgi:hypothetical protein
MNTKHTPAPWTFIESDNARIPDRIVAANGSTVAYGTIGVNRTDTALISAAPDLLAALQNMLAYWNQGSFHPAVSQACEAIAKATGEQA